MAKADYNKEMLYSFFRKNKGNITQMSKDPDCPVHSRTTLTEYAFSEGWHERYEQEFAEMNNKFTDSTFDNLMKIKNSLISKLEGMMKSEDITIREIYVIWKILRTELGLPIRITGSAQIIQNQSENRPIYERSMEEVNAEFMKIMEILEDSDS